MRIIRFSLPYIDEQEIRAVEEVLRSGWWTTGKVVERFEQDFCKYIGCRYSLAVNSATAALHLALRAMGVGEGDEVIVPTMTFAATAEVVIHCGARPILCDCNPRTLNIDTDDLKRKITRRTKAVIIVHMAGLPCDMDEILSITNKYGLYVLEDAAHALGAKYADKNIGRFGDFAAFSFYATKPISTGEGGMLVVDNRRFADLARSLSLHGLTKNAWSRYASAGSAHYDIIHAGFKYNMPDILAAIGVYQLKKAGLFLKARRNYAMMYTDAFRGNCALEPPVSPAGFRHAWHLYIIKLNLKYLRINRDGFMEKLKKEGVPTSIHFMPLHLHSFYKRAFGYKKADFPEATQVYKRIISLPLYPSMMPSDVNFVIGKVLKTVARYQQ